MHKESRFKRTCIRIFENINDKNTLGFLCDLPIPATFSAFYHKAYTTECILMSVKLMVINDPMPTMLLGAMVTLRHDSSPGTTVAICPLFHNSPSRALQSIHLS